jgi:hypothetical protein
MGNGSRVFINAKVTAQLLINNSGAKTRDTIQRAVDQTCGLPDYNDVDKKRLADILELENNLVYDSTDSILENREHEAWLYPSGQTVRKDRSIEWRFWNDYRNNLMVKGWPQKVIDVVDEMTTKILMRLEDPLREGPWDRRGLVVGDVQSGKTANYTGLICKAADAGYRVIVIFAGLHNSLRSQTQQRLDDDFIGFDSDKDDKGYQTTFRIGVGRVGNHPAVHYVTTSNERGDFSRQHANQTGVNPASRDPIIMIVKKNKSILENLRNWALRMGRQEGSAKIRNIPLLAIDDECDNASINTNVVPKDENGNPVSEYDPTAINERIRDFLNAFEQKAYVGYTATPYANILIHREGYHEVIGEDLFPRDFIINLPRPSNHIGPQEVFGIDEDPDLGIEGSAGYPLYRIVDDHALAIPDKHKKDLDVFDLPSSLKEALHAFILSCAARRVRGYTTVHNSMLVHVTRFTRVQHQVYELVKSELVKTSNRLRYGDGDSSKNIWKEFEYLWEKEFLQRTSKPMKALGLGEVHSWDEIRHEILPSIERLQFKEINGQAGDILEYKKYREAGINVIVIGGDKLSRGLTLEGLTVSYYLRSAKMYDTLMQMGRWFGYRDGYLDLCRIYTTRELITWYRHIALASLELKQEFDYMVENGEKPEKYGMKIRAHPGALLVTALNKMRNGTRMKVTFHGGMVQTLFIHNEPQVVRDNFFAVENLIRGRHCEHLGGQVGGFRFDKVAAQHIRKFLSEYKTHIRNQSFKAAHLISYIDKLNANNELIEWTVIVLSKEGDKKAGKKLSGIDEYLGLTKRTAFEVNNEYISFAKTLLSPGHERLDLTESELRELKRKGETPKNIRACRDPKRGLLLLYPVWGPLEENNSIVYGESECPIIGYVISFSGQGEQREVEYIVDSLYPDELEALN